MAPKLYMRKSSPPCRAVFLTVKALGIDLEYIELNRGDAFNLKLNPSYTVPSLDDDGRTIWDSHAINPYLFSKYATNDSLYPEDPHKRAVVNQRLHFDSGVAFATAKQIRDVIVVKHAKIVPSELIEATNAVYGFLESFLEGQPWVAGDDITLADFSLIPTVTTLDVMVALDEDTFPNVAAWIKRAQGLPYYEVNQEGLGDFRNFYTSYLNA